MNRLIPSGRRARVCACALLVTVLVAGEVVVAAAAEPASEDPVAADAASLEGLASEVPTPAAPELAGGDFNAPSPPTASQGPLKSEPYDTSRAVPVRELPERRSAAGEVWENADGTFTQNLFSAPKYFQSASTGGWEPIDSRLLPVAEAPGQFKNAANSWAVTIEPIGPEATGGIRTENAGQTVRFSPYLDIKEPIAPQVDGDTALYPDVALGMDLRYTISSYGVKEDIILKDPSAGSSLDFAIEGANLAAVPSSPGAFRAEGPAEIHVAAPTLAGKDGRPILDRVKAEEVRNSGSGKDDLRVSVDEVWLKSLKASDFPITIDPPTVIGANWWYSYATFGSGCICDQAVGNARPSGQDGYWRSIVKMPCEPLINEDYRVLDAKIKLHCTALLVVLTWSVWMRGGRLATRTTTRVPARANGTSVRCMSRAPVTTRSTRRRCFRSG